MNKFSYKLIAIAIILIAIQTTLTAQPIGTQIKTDTSGHISYWNGLDSWIAIAPGLPGHTLTFTAGVPSWVNNPNGISTNAVSNITANTAFCGGNILSDGGDKITIKGVCWSTIPEPTIVDNITIDGWGIGSFSSIISGLSAGTTYYIRAYASNSEGTAYGNETSITTTVIFPILTTNAINSISTTTAISGGNISYNGGANIIARGVCWSTSVNPTVALSSKTTDGNGTGSFISNITGLISGTTYFVRAYATNSAGTAYGNEFSFTTNATVTDFDGNIYDTVHIGTQVWMKQNLKTTHYKNGAAITFPGTNDTAWENNTTGAYAWFDDDETTFKNTYGALYNWYAVNTGNLCPTGWHVPTDAEWTTLTTYLGGESIAGGKLKATTLWHNPNTGATNSSGFTALPGGYRIRFGAYSFIGDNGWWWSSTETNTTNAWSRHMAYNISYALRLNYIKAYGFSVRCIKD